MQLRIRDSKPDIFVSKLRSVVSEIDIVVAIRRNVFRNEAVGSTSKRVALRDIRQASGSGGYKGAGIGRP